MLNGLVDARTSQGTDLRAAELLKENASAHQIDAWVGNPGSEGDVGGSARLSGGFRSRGALVLALGDRLDLGGNKGVLWVGSRVGKVIDIVLRDGNSGGRGLVLARLLQACDLIAHVNGNLQRCQVDDFEEDIQHR